MVNSYGPAMKNKPEAAGGRSEGVGEEDSREISEENGREINEGNDREISEEISREINEEKEAKETG